MRLVIRGLIVLEIMFVLVNLATAGEKDFSDPRLDQNVTVECVNMRLHAALEKISDLTGVSIYSGRNMNDWQVRDIPVTICVKDMPLEDLLHNIARSTHLYLGAEKIEKATAYRIWRDKKHELLMSEYLQARKDTTTAQSKWMWNATAKYKDFQDNQLLKDPDDPDHAFERARSSLIAALGPEARDRVLAGDVLRFTLQDAPSFLDGILKNLFCAYNNSLGLNDGDFQRCVVIICNTNDSNGTLSLTMSIMGSVGRGSYFFNGDQISPQAREDAKIPPVPQPPSSEPGIEDPNGDFEILMKSTYSNLPILKTKISLVAPKNNRKMTCGDLLKALSAASGYSIICEDFESHTDRVKVENLFKLDTTIGDTLRALSPYARSDWDYAGIRWYINERDKIILGTTLDWPYRHRDLVSEDLFSYLYNKLNGNGITLDDYLQIEALTDYQCRDWISNSRDLKISTRYGRPSHKELWLLYASMSPADKLRAQSDAGIALGGTYANALSEIFKYHNKERKRKEDMTMGHIFHREEIPTDPQVISTIVMHVNKSEDRYFKYEAVHPEEKSQSGEGFIKLLSYTMELKGVKDSMVFSMDVGEPVRFAAYSPQRAAKLGIKPPGTR